MALQILPSALAGANSGPALQQNFSARPASRRSPTSRSKRRQSGVTIPNHCPLPTEPRRSPTESDLNQLGPSLLMAHIVRAGMLPPQTQLARSPSRPGSPGQVMQRSPSLMDRQTPVNAHQGSLNAELSRPPISVLPMNGFQPHGSPGMANPGMGGPRAPNMMGVSLSCIFLSPY